MINDKKNKNKMENIQIIYRKKKENNNLKMKFLDYEIKKNLLNRINELTEEGVYFY